LRGVFLLRRITYLVTTALLTMLIVVPAVLAQEAVPGDDNPHSPEPNAVVVGSHEELERIAGQPVPSQHPGEPPDQGKGLPKTGGPSVSAVLPAAALLLIGSGVLAYVVVLRRGQEEEGGSVR
jgi:LPXTG-motif cell wall-anchored protein